MSSNKKAHEPVDLGHDPVLEEIIRRLVEVYTPERIYLFGSKARGDEGPDSDYDLLVVVPDDTKPDQMRSGLAYEALWGLKTSAWQKCMTPRLRPK